MSYYANSKKKRMKQGYLPHRPLCVLFHRTDPYIFMRKLRHLQPIQSNKYDANRLALAMLVQTSLLSPPIYQKA